MADHERDVGTARDVVTEHIRDGSVGVSFDSLIFT